MGELSISDVFLILKPLCDSFIEKPDVNKAEEIAKLIEKTPNFIVQKVSENILQPITYHLRKNTFSKDQNLKLVLTIHAVVQKIKINNLKLFHEIYHCLRIQICQEKNSMELIEAHEELKETVILCLMNLFKNISYEIIESLYTRQNAALLSHGIYLSVKLARLEKSPSLRLAALQAVMALWQVHDEADASDIVLQNQIADVVMLYLPGVVSGLLEVALGSDVQNHKITVLAVKAWSRTLNLVMKDEIHEENSVPLINMDTIKTKDPSDLEKMKHVLETAKRTPEWFNAVSEKFKILFTELDNLTKHTNFKVRQELAAGICLLLTNCSRNMQLCFQTFLDILITLSEDENPNVSLVAREAFLKIQNQCFEDKSMRPAVEMLEENLYNLLLKIPRIIRTSGEADQIMWLNRLAGYLKVLGKHKLSQILLSTAHLNKLLLALVYIMELDCNGISVLEDTVVTNFNEIEYYGISRSWKQFKFLYDSNSVQKLHDIFRIIGDIEDKKIIIDSILNMTLRVAQFQKEFFLMVNTMLEVPMEPELKMSICKQVLEQYISKDFWDLEFKISDETSLQDVQSNVIQCCILLEGLGKIAQVLEEDYQYFLLKTLYIIIEKAGSDNSLIRFMAISTLEKISKSQKIDTVGDLFRLNVDYISYHVILKLRRVERNPGVLDVVNVVTNYSTMDFLPHLRDIVDDLLLQSSSNLQKRNVQSFLKVFHAFVMCVKRLTASDEKNIKNEEKEQTPAEIILASFQEFLDALKNSTDYENNEEEDVEKIINDKNFQKPEFDEDGTNIEEDVKPDIPYYVNMIKSIMNRCLHFLPSENYTVSTLSMATLREGAFILKNWEDELLPIVHELWHPLVGRFENSNPLVINYAWKLLCCLGEVSESFIRSRTLKEVLPSISRLLKNSCKESFKKGPKSSYTYTQMFKLQKEILSQLGKLMVNLKFREKELWDMLGVTESYLHNQQNVELQLNCVNMYKEVSDYNADLVWIKCIDIWNRQVEHIAPVNNLEEWYSTKVLNLEDGMKSNFHQNLKNILDYINEKTADL